MTQLKFQVNNLLKSIGTTNNNSVTTPKLSGNAPGPATCMRCCAARPMGAVVVIVVVTVVIEVEVWNIVVRALIVVWVTPETVVTVVWKNDCVRIPVVL